MPKYVFVDVNTNKEVEVDRIIEHHQVPPMPEEAVEGGLTVEEAQAADWKKLFKLSNIIRGETWGKKGTWGS